MAKIVSRGDPIEPIYLNNLRVAAHGWGVVSGLAVSQRGAGANMSVDVASGDAWINGTKITKSSTTNVAITAAHATYDRYDLVVINSSGTISVIDGTAAATSYANDYDLETNNAILLAEVYVPATDTTIEDAQITDKRIISFVEEINLAVDIGLEEYSNHLGAVDNFTQTGVAGTGSVNADATNHEMDLSCGLNVGHARFETKDTFVVSAKPTVINILIQNIVDGVSGNLVSFVGCKADMSSTSVLNSMGFRQIGDNTWETVSGDASSSENNSITALANDDLLTIVATSSSIRFFVNSTLVQTHTTYIPGIGVKMGGSVENVFGSPSTARQISIDMMGIKAYH